MLCFSVVARRCAHVGLGLLLLLMSLPTLAQRALWAEASAAAVPRRQAANLRGFRSVTFQLNAVRNVLRTAPAENGPAEVGPVLTLPLPDGRAGRFRVVAVPVMAPALAARYPNIRTYAAQGLDDPTATARLDVSPAGLHAQILSAAGTSYIDPAAPGDDTHYLVFDRQAMRRPADFACQVGPRPTSGLAPPPLDTRQRPNGAQLRTYRLALACTGEYAATKGGTVAGALAAMVTSINRVDGIYERELAIRLVLIPQTDTLIFLNAAADPYTNEDGAAMLTQNQATITARVGAAAYDVGHVFSTGGGGIAAVGVVCLNAEKAAGVTGTPAPVGDAFDVDYVAHELGHQFGGTHTFNSTLGSCGGQRSADSAYEPGSGSTIMAYAGICGADNLQPNSDAYFHSRSYDQILTYLTTTACATTTATGNQPPAVDAGAAYRIPLNTPFTLTGTATDPDNDALTYAWEEYDLGPAGAPEAPQGNAPIFRFSPPTTSPSRTFPRLPDLAAGTTTKGELLPTYARRLHFRLVARDNRPGGGGVEYDTTSVAVAGTAGPFRVTAPNTAVAWQAGAPQQVTWDVANTTAAPVSAAAVDLRLSTDGGLTFPTLLLAATPNDGCATVTIPAGVSTVRARLQVRATGNIFFDISDADFTIRPLTAPTFVLAPDCLPGGALTVCPQSTAALPLTLAAVGDFSGDITLGSSDLPAGVQVTFPTPTTAAGTAVTATVRVGSTAAAGTYTFLLTGSSGGVVQQQAVRLVVPPLVTQAVILSSPVRGALAAGAAGLSWQAVPNATSYEVQVATDVAFANVLGAPTTAALAAQLPAALPLNRTYFWRVRGAGACGPGPYSAPASFRTVETACATYPAPQVVRLPVGQLSAQSSVPVTDTAPVAAVRVRDLALTYTDLSRLTLTLTNPTGQRATLFSQGCAGTTSLTATFDAQAATALRCPPAAAATYQPATSFAPLLGSSAQGTWTLTVTSNATFATGQLTGWTLEICTLPPAARPVATTLGAGLAVYPNPSTGIYQLVIDNGQAGPVPLRVTDALGRTVITRTLTKTDALLAYSLDLTNLARGAYWLQLTLPTGPVVVRLLRI